MDGWIGRMDGWMYACMVHACSVQFIWQIPSMSLIETHDGRTSDNRHFHVVNLYTMIRLLWGSRIISLCGFRKSIIRWMGPPHTSASRGAVTRRITPGWGYRAVLRTLRQTTALSTPAVRGVERWGSPIKASPAPWGGNPGHGTPSPCVPRADAAADRIGAGRGGGPGTRQTSFLSLIVILI